MIFRSTYRGRKAEAHHSANFTELSVSLDLHFGALNSLLNLVVVELPGFESFYVTVEFCYGAFKASISFAIRLSPLGFRLILVQLLLHDFGLTQSVFDSSPLILNITLSFYTLPSASPTLASAVCRTSLTFAH